MLYRRLREESRKGRFKICQMTLSDVESKRYLSPFLYKLELLLMSMIGSILVMIDDLPPPFSQTFQTCLFHLFIRVCRNIILVNYTKYIFTNSTRKEGEIVIRR